MIKLNRFMFHSQRGFKRVFEVVKKKPTLRFLPCTPHAWSHHSWGRPCCPRPSKSLTNPVLGPEHPAHFLGNPQHLIFQILRHFCYSNPSRIPLGLVFLLLCCHFSSFSTLTFSSSSSFFTPLPLQHINVLGIRLLDQAMFDKPENLDK